jgi:cyclase
MTHRSPQPLFGSPVLPVMLMLAAIVMCAPTPLSAQAARLAEGVYVITHGPAPDGFPQGNTTVVIGERSVLVVDATYLPSTARQDIALIRSWTDKPVRYVVNTHWHNDHNVGNSAYVEAFPDVRLVAHVETKADMDRLIPSTLPRLRASQSRYGDSLRRGVTVSGSALSAADRATYESVVNGWGQVIAEHERIRYRSPDLTFTDQLVVDLGGREVHVRFLGRANTAGDAVVFLPRERIVAVGDLLVAPLPYTYDGYPSEWIGTLDRVAALGPAMIVPGHGGVQRDLTFLHAVRDLMASAVQQVNARVAVVGSAAFRTPEEVVPYVDLGSFRTRFGAATTADVAAFDAMAARLAQLVFRESALR